MKQVPLAMLLLAWSPCVKADEKQVTVMRTPGRGIQPQARMDAKGNVHLLYFHGEPGRGNLMYVRREAGKTDFSAPVRVNSQEGSAIALGTMRGGQLALGRNGIIHVSWNGTLAAEPKNPIAGAPMLYARLDPKTGKFEPQRNLMTRSAILDGGGTLAADAEGNVYVAWHGLGQDLVKGENNRKVWIGISRDDGATFAAERQAWSENTGACGCCGMRGWADARGNLCFLYRGAADGSKRGMYLLRSNDRGKTFTGAALDDWQVLTCPLSSEALAEGTDGVCAAWDNDGQMFFTRIRPGKDAEALKAAPGNAAARKHPAIAFNKKGEMILVWTEGTGWNRGGSLAWQVYDSAGKPTSESGRRQGAIPVWGLPTVVAEADGQFTIWH